MTSCMKWMKSTRTSLTLTSLWWLAQTTPSILLHRTIQILGSRACLYWKFGKQNRQVAVLYDCYFFPWYLWRGNRVLFTFFLQFVWYKGQAVSLMIIFNPSCMQILRGFWKLKPLKICYSKIAISAFPSASVWKRIFRVKPLVRKWVLLESKWTCRRNSCAYIWMVLHVDSFWHRGKRQLENGFEYLKPKTNLLPTKQASQPISNRNKTKTKTKTKVIAWLLSALNIKPLYRTQVSNHYLRSSCLLVCKGSWLM